MQCQSILCQRLERMSLYVSLCIYKDSLHFIQIPTHYYAVPKISATFTLPNSVISISTQWHLFTFFLASILESLNLVIIHLLHSVTWFWQKALINHEPHFLLPYFLSFCSHKLQLHLLCFTFLQLSSALIFGFPYTLCCSHHFKIFAPPVHMLYIQPSHLMIGVSFDLSPLFKFQHKDQLCDDINALTHRSLHSELLFRDLFFHLSFQSDHLINRLSFLTCFPHLVKLHTSWDDKKKLCLFAPSYVPEYGAILKIR